MRSLLLVIYLGVHTIAALTPTPHPFVIAEEWHYREYTVGAAGDAHNATCWWEGGRICWMEN